MQQALLCEKDSHVKQGLGGIFLSNTEKKKVDEEMVDRIIEETKEQQKSFKERMYDKVTMPLWLLDIFIVLLVAALAAVLIFGRA